MWTFPFWNFNRLSMDLWHIITFSGFCFFMDSIVLLRLPCKILYCTNSFPVFFQFYSLLPSGSGSTAPRLAARGRCLHVEHKRAAPGRSIEGLAPVDLWQWLAGGNCACALLCWCLLLSESVTRVMWTRSQNLPEIEWRSMRLYMRQGWLSGCVGHWSDFSGPLPIWSYRLPEQRNLSTWYNVRFLFEKKNAWFSAHDNQRNRGPNFRSVWVRSSILVFLPMPVYEYNTPSVWFYWVCFFLGCCGNIVRRCKCFVPKHPYLLPAHNIDFILLESNLLLSGSTHACVHATSAYPCLADGN